MSKGSTNMFSLTSRIALVTGGAGHLGSAMVTALAEYGAHVYVNGRNREQLAALVNALRNQGFKATAVGGDITRVAVRKRIIDRIATKEGRLDILLNNAHDPKPGTMATAEPEDFSKAYDIAVTSAFSLMKLSYPILKLAANANKGGASVINISSMYGVVSPDLRIYGEEDPASIEELSTGGTGERANGGSRNRNATGKAELATRGSSLIPRPSSLSNPPFYGAAKAGLIQLSRYAACEWGRDNIRVNALTPGPFPRESVERTMPRLYRTLCRKTALGRIGAASELTGVVVFLGSDASSYVTGAVIPVDGGWTAW